jgi:hypothetical protein
MHKYFFQTLFSVLLGIWSRNKIAEPYGIAVPFGGTRGWTTDLGLARQALYQLNLYTSPFCVGHF